MEPGVKALRVDFLRRPRWLIAWLPACMVLGTVLGASIQQGRMLEAQTRATREQAARLAAQATEKLKVQAQLAAEQARDPRRAELASVASALSRDWNPAFATVENLRQPGLRVLQLHLDGASGSIRLEYEVDAFAQAAAVTADLNAGYATAPWRLESIGRIAAATGPGNERLRAAWTARIDTLR